VSRGVLAAAFVIALPITAAAPANGPAGHVLFSRGEDIWVARLDGTHARRVAGGPGPQDDPSWAPDGRSFVYRDSTGVVTTSKANVARVELFIHGQTQGSVALGGGKLKPYSDYMKVTIALRNRQ